MAEENNEWIKNFCNKHCTVKKETYHEAFFTAEELRKVRQKRPTLVQNYEMSPYVPSKFQKAMKDISEINSMLDQF